MSGRIPIQSLLCLSSTTSNSYSSYRHNGSVPPRTPPPLNESEEEDEDEMEDEESEEESEEEEGEVR